MKLYSSVKYTRPVKYTVEKPIPLEVKESFEFVSAICLLTLCRSPGCRAHTAAVQLVADRNLWCMAGRLQEIDTARGQDNMHTAGCLGRDRESFL